MLLRATSAPRCIGGGGQSQPRPNPAPALLLGSPAPGFGRSPVTKNSRPCSSGRAWKKACRKSCLHATAAGVGGTCVAFVSTSVMHTTPPSHKHQRLAQYHHRRHSHVVGDAGLVVAAVLVVLRVGEPGVDGLQGGWQKGREGRMCLLSRRNLGWRGGWQAGRWSGVGLGGVGGLAEY